jgi:hypothetical protein
MLDDGHMPRLVWPLALVAAVVLVLEPLSSQERPVFKPVSFAILEDYDKGEELREVEADFRLFQTLEIGTWRGRLRWADFEPERGTYDFDWLHEFAALARRHHLMLRPSIAHTPEWAARAGGADMETWNNPPADLDDWRRFTTALGAALARHSHVASFEIYNEPNARQWWEGTAVDYADVLTTGARAFRASAPGRMVLFGGLTMPGVEWLEQVCQVPQASGSFDVLPIHSYPESSSSTDDTVEDFVAGLDGFLATADQACGRKAIWINETGFATTPGRTELEQAVWWVRAITSFLAHPRVEHIGISRIKDAAADRPVIGDAPNDHLGLTRSDRTRKLAFGTIDMLTDLLDTGRLAVDTAQLQVRMVGGPDAFDSARATKAGLYYQLFTRADEDKVLIVWSTDASMMLAIEVPGIRSSVEYNLAGQPSAYDQDASGLSELAITAGMPRIFKLLR